MGSPVEAFLIDNGKSPDAPLNASTFFWLPPDTPYGNLTLKLFKLSERIDEANRHLLDSVKYWNILNHESQLASMGQLQPEFMHPNALQRHIYATEIAILMIRRAADEIIAFVSCLVDWEKEKKFPQRIRIGEIGKLLDKKNAQYHPELYAPHISMLQLLNDIANAFKHSFVQTDITLIGIDEPTVNALYLPHNKLDDNKHDSGMRFYSVSLSTLISDFSRFYADSIAWLRHFSERHRPRSTSTSPLESV